MPRPQNDIPATPRIYRAYIYLILLFSRFDALEYCASKQTSRSRKIPAVEKATFSAHFYHAAMTMIYAALRHEFILPAKINHTGTQH